MEAVFRQYTLRCCTCKFIHLLTVLASINRSSRPEAFCKKGVLRHFGKYLCQSLFLNKVVGLSPATLLKKRLWYRCFPVNFVKFLRTTFYIEHLWWLLLNKAITREKDCLPYVCFVLLFFSLALVGRSRILSAFKMDLFVNKVKDWKLLLL